VDAFPLWLSVTATVIAVFAAGYWTGSRHGRRVDELNHRVQLTHASRLSVVGELTTSIAHEISQPLSAILSNADAGGLLLDRGDSSLSEVRAVLADIRRDGSRASEVISRIRLLARKREPVMEILDANAVASEVIAIMGPEARRRQLSLASSLADEPLWIRGDRTLLGQVLVNLLMNAIESVESLPAGTSAGRQASVLLSVSTTADGEPEIRIVDQGQGIPPKAMQRLFESFSTSKPHGMGLGLSISRSIVEAHGGRIRAENNHGPGASIFITLPRYDDQQV
jgi:signal transduction histidine kinase